MRNEVDERKKLDEDEVLCQPPELTSDLNVCCIKCFPEALVQN